MKLPETLQAVAAVVAVIVACETCDQIRKTNGIHVHWNDNPQVRGVFVTWAKRDGLAFRFGGIAVYGDPTNGEIGAYCWPTGDLYTRNSYALRVDSRGLAIDVPKKGFWQPRTIRPLKWW